jgi:hypothetical protein
MAKYTANVTATGNTYLCDIVRPRHADAWSGTVIARGTFGSTTLTLGISDDGGSTVIPLTDFSITANGATSVPALLSSGENGEDIKLYATATSGSGIDIDVTVYDNR